MASRGEQSCPQGGFGGCPGPRSEILSTVGFTQALVRLVRASWGCRGGLSRANQQALRGASWGWVRGHANKPFSRLHLLVASVRWVFPRYQINESDHRLGRCAGCGAARARLALSKAIKFFFRLRYDAGVSTGRAAAASSRNRAGDAVSGSTVLSARSARAAARPEPASGEGAASA